jgi:hypothetical protein
MKCQQKLLRFFFKQVDQDNVISKLREIPESTPANIGRLGIIKGWDGMGYIYNGEPRIGSQELCLYRTHQVILGTDIRGEG